MSEISIKQLEMLDGLVRDGLIMSYTAPTPSGSLMQVTREELTLRDGTVVAGLTRRFLDGSSREGRAGVGGGNLDGSRATFPAGYEDGRSRG